MVINLLVKLTFVTFEIVSICLLGIINLVFAYMCFEPLIQVGTPSHLCHAPLLSVITCYKLPSTVEITVETNSDPQMPS